MSADNPPWASGPGEILRHGLGLLKNDSDRNRRLAMISAAEREEIVEATAASQFRFHPFGALQLAALRGDEAKITALIESSRPTAVSRGAGLALAFIDYATAVLYNGLGRYEVALASAQQASEHPQELMYTLILPS